MVRRQPHDHDELHPRRRPVDEGARLRPDREHLLRRRPQRQPHRHPGVRRRRRPRRSASPGRWRTSSARTASPSTASPRASCCPTRRPQAQWDSLRRRTASRPCSSGSRSAARARPDDIARGVPFFVAPGRRLGQRPDPVHRRRPLAVLTRPPGLRPSRTDRPTGAPCPTTSPPRRGRPPRRARRALLPRPAHVRPLQRDAARASTSSTTWRATRAPPRAPRPPPRSAAVAAEADALDVAGLDDAERTDRDVLAALARGAGGRRPALALGGQRLGEGLRQPAGPRLPGRARDDGRRPRPRPTGTSPGSPGSRRVLRRASASATPRRPPAGRVPTPDGRRARRRAARGLPRAAARRRPAARPDRHGAAGRSAASPAARRSDSSSDPSARRWPPRRAAARRAAAGGAARRPRRHPATCPGGSRGYADAVARHTTTDLTPDEIHRIGLEVLEEHARRAGRDRRPRPRRARASPRIADAAARRPRAPLRDRAQEIIDVAQGALDRAAGGATAAFPDYDIADCAIEADQPDRGRAARSALLPSARRRRQPPRRALPAQRQRPRDALPLRVRGPGLPRVGARATTCSSRPRSRSTSRATGGTSTWRRAASTRAGGCTPSSSPTSRASTATTSRGSACSRCRASAPAGWWSTPACTHFGWSRERAVEFMSTTPPRPRARPERGRPLHRLARTGAGVHDRPPRDPPAPHRRAQALGDAFSIRDFHGTVLGNGAVPLTVLADAVTRWQQRATAAV